MKKAGIDLVDVPRFRRFKKSDSHPFLQNVFTKAELKYCFGHKDPAPHLAGLFVAKEAASKALGVKKFPFAKIRIVHTKDGAPEAWRGRRKLPISISITHTDTIAAAVAIR